MKRIISAVSNDICTDNRVHKIALTLLANGFDVTIAGRLLNHSKDLSERPYNTIRFNLLFNKGPLFYAALNLRLFFYLLASKVDIILSNDLDTLPACRFAAAIKKKKLVYDSHELFPEVPELLDRPVVKSIWSFIERKLIKKIDLRMTVSPSIAQYYKDIYNVSFEVVRNISRFRSENELKQKRSGVKSFTIIYQGALNIGRGIELAILSMQHIDNSKLIIAGTGDIDKELKDMVAELSFHSKIEFTGRLSFDELWNYTRNADIGLSIEENLGLNYRYALPNKLFDYIQARIPVVVSDLPEMKSVVNKYQIGEILIHRTPHKLAALINHMLKVNIPEGKYETYLESAANELNWEKEEKKIVQLFKLLYE